MHRTNSTAVRRRKGYRQTQRVLTNTTGRDRRVLLIEDNAADAKRIRGALAEARGGPFDVVCVRRLVDGLECLRAGSQGAVFVDLVLPDSQGLDTLDELLLAAPQVPIILLCGVDDEDVALRGLQRGARDYLLKAYLDSYSCSRALHNMIERKAMEDALFAEKERAQVTLDSIGDAVISTDVNSRITYLNLVAEGMTGWHRGDAIGRTMAEVFHVVDGKTREDCKNPMELAMQQGKIVSLNADCLLIRRDGAESSIEDSAAPIYDRQGHVTGAVIVARDVSATKALSLKMCELAQHDVLTGLPNRAYLNDRIAQAITAANRHSTKFAVLFLDLDHFKHINDSLGHPLGDRLLQSVAGRLVASVRACDTVSRQGGDEFVILLSDITDAKNAALCAKKLLTMLKAPNFIGHHGLEVSASIGISLYPDDGPNAETLIKTADTAMYQAKENGRNNYNFFEQEMNTRAVARQSIEEDLRGALERQEFTLQYQPKVDLQTGAITGVEALIRWQHPQRGLVNPLSFVPVAEDSGLILPIGTWVRREACHQARLWQDAGLPALPMSVNISVVEFRDQNFLESIRCLLRETRVKPDCLELELTESVLMQHAETTTTVLQQLKIMGVQLAVDDFGTGYSSLSYLRRFPIDVLKIDRSFVREITSNPDDATIVSAVINMGRSLKQRVIAEGVETHEQLTFLRDQQCAEGQGYYFSPPVLPHEFAKLLATGFPENSARKVC